MRSYEESQIEEVRQSYARFGYIMLIAPILIYLNNYFPQKINQLNFVYIIFTAYAALHYIFIKYFPSSAVLPRKLLAIIADITATSFFVYYLDRYGFIFHLLYIWIIMGNGLRFGPRYLFFAMGVSITAISLIYFYSPFWHSRIYLIVYMILTAIVIPLFALLLMRRLREKNRELSKLLQLVEKQSKIDSLTGIPNRFSFELEIKRYMSRDIPFALLFIDIDGFKSVNDNYGHDVGDQVLREIARRLAQSTGKSEFFARLGGDEFVVMSRRRGEAIRNLAESIRKNLSRPYGKKGEIDNLSASIGISYFPKDTDDEFMLKRYADIAMYAVKQGGKNGYMEYCDCWEDKKPKTVG
jgi:diguanylate cyclase (GGDEF)-like protein